MYTKRDRELIKTLALCVIDMAGLVYAMGESIKKIEKSIILLPTTDNVSLTPGESTWPQQEADVVGRPPNS